MRFQITTDYAIRIIIYMAQHGTQGTTAKQAAKQLGITYSYFNKVATKLRMTGFIESIQGPKGGYRLAKEVGNITLYDIVESIEGSILINRCLDEDNFCSRNATDVCPVHKIFESLQSQIIRELKSVRIYDLCTL